MPTSTIKFIFTVPGEPKGKGRPRFTRRGRTYTPNDTLTYEGTVWNIFKTKYEDSKPLPGAFALVIRAYMSIPKSTSKKRRFLMLIRKIWPIKKPDVDNIAKIVMDALNGTAYIDDAACVSLLVEKEYSDTPRVEIEIHNREVEEE